jgi:hypothetical protein
MTVRRRTLLDLPDNRPGTVTLPAGGGLNCSDGNLELLAVVEARVDARSVQFTI